MTPATRFAALALGATLALAAPAAAADGGAPLGDTPAASTSPVATRTAAGITLSARRTGLVRKRHAFSGAVPRRAANGTVAIQRRTGSRWRTVATATPSSMSRFAASYVPRAPGRYTYRATVVGGAARSAPQIGVTVYERARATWYGPGFWGNRTACGQTLTRSTLGVAHKTLTCGTKVALMYGGRTMTVDVIDRGPFHPDVEYDLTEATKDELRMPGTSTIGALPRR
jgi:rare lipoprotein A